MASPAHLKPALPKVRLIEQRIRLLPHVIRKIIFKLAERTPPDARCFHPRSPISCLFFPPNWPDKNPSFCRQRWEHRCATQEDRTQHPSASLHSATPPPSV